MELATMAKMVSIAAVSIGVVMFVLGHFLGLTLIENFYLPWVSWCVWFPRECLRL